MKKLFLSLTLYLVFAPSIFAITVTIASTTTAGSTTYPGSTCTLRIYSSITFAASDGTVVMQGTPGSGAFFKAVACTISSGIITIPAFTIPSTTDALDNQNARYTAVFYDSRGVRRDTFFADFPVPASLGASTTWALLRIHKTGVQPIRDTSTYSKFQVDALIAQATTNVPDASTTSKGKAQFATDGESSALEAVQASDVRLETVFNVKAYGATGDGTTDDTAAIASAKTAAEADCGTLFFPPGTFINGATLQVNPCVTIRGGGKGATVIKRKASFAGALLFVVATSIEGLTIDGNYTNNLGNTGAELALASNSVMRDVEIKNANWMNVQAVGENIQINGIRIVGVGSATLGAPYGVWADDVDTTITITNSVMYNMRYGAIFLSTKGATISNNLIFSNHWSIDPGGGGQIATKSTGKNISISGNWIGPGAGALTSGIENDPPGTAITGNTIVGQPLYGIIHQDGDYSATAGNTIVDSGTNAIRMEAAAVGNTLAGNTLRGTGATISDSGVGTIRSANSDGITTVVGNNGSTWKVDISAVDPIVKIYRWSGSGANFYPWHIHATNQVLAFRAGTAGSFGAIGSESMSTYFSITNGGAINFNTDNYASCTGLTTNASAVVGCTTSSAKFKKSLLGFNNGLQALRSITPFTFNWRSGVFADDGKRHLGLIAENLETANPLLVSRTGKGDLQPEPLALHAATISAVKELDVQLRGLKQIVAAQQREIKKLRKRL